MSHNSSLSDDYWQSDEWSRKSVLAFDGGGIKGYSSLLIVHALMLEIATIEKDLLPCAESSVFPLQRRAVIRRPPAPAVRTRTTFRLRRAEGEYRPVFNRSKDWESASNYLPCHYFDYIAGSSTGGLIAIMLGRLGMTIDECLEAFERLAHCVFRHPRMFHVRRFPPFLFPRPKYNEKLLEGIIKEIVCRYELNGHKDSKFPQQNVFGCRTIVTAYPEKTRTGTRRPYLFRSYRHPAPEPYDDFHRKQMFNRDNFSIWQVARATSAAPSYFASVNLVEVGDDDKYKFVDGGWGCNNPIEEVLWSIGQLKPLDPNATSIAVSIGTGKPAEVSDGGKAFNSLSFGYYFDIIKSSIKQATDSECVHDRVLGKTNEKGIPYFRLNVGQGLGDMKLDAFKGDHGEETFVQIQGTTAAWLAQPEVKEKLRECAQSLVDIRRKRAHHQAPPVEEPIQQPSAANENSPSAPTNNTPSSVVSNRENWQDRLYLWERFIHDVEYRCPERCQTLADQLYDRRGLRDHMISHHRFSHGQVLEDKLDEAKKFPLSEES